MSNKSENRLKGVLPHGDPTKDERRPEMANKYGGPTLHKDPAGEPFPNMYDSDKINHPSQQREVKVPAVEANKAEKLDSIEHPANQRKSYHKLG